ALMVLMAMSAAVTPMVGQNYGALKFERVQQSVNWCYRFSLIYGLAVAALMAGAAGFIAGAFTDNADAIATTKMHMRIVPISYIALGCAMSVNSAFNAIGKPMPAMFISMTRTILVYAPLAFLFANLFGLVGVFAAACTANFIAGGVGTAWFRMVFRAKMADHQQTVEASA
ncbi:MAG: MATE family efflux transporter, partial [Gammaproteobacteria bacterium]|nr:MATE family efflux transporter [Gammaproteobacteria bacterium]